MNLKACKVALILAALSIALNGCLAFGGVDRDTAVIDKSVGTARNSAILLNIVRASRHEPLYFYALSRVSGTATEDFKLSLPPVTLGPHQTAAQKTFTFGLNGLNVLESNKGGSFDVALLESQNFYAGMLEPLQLNEIDILLKQGFPRELVYRLAVQDVLVYAKGPDGREGYRRLVNDPSNPQTYAAFNVFFQGAMSRGVVTETYLAPDSDLAANKTAAKTVPSTGKLAPHYRLCVDPALINLADAEAQYDMAHSNNICGERPGQAPQTNGDSMATADLPGLKQTYESCKALEPSAKGTAGVAPATLQTSTTENSFRVCTHLNRQLVAVQLDTRSLFGIFNLLGAELARQTGEGPGASITLDGLGAPTEPHAHGNLLTVVKGDASPCFAIATYQGRYCVPTTGSENLKTTFSIINALQALKTSTGDLPVTQAVRIEQ